MIRRTRLLYYFRSPLYFRTPIIQMHHLIMKSKYHLSLPDLSSKLISKVESERPSFVSRIMSSFIVATGACLAIVFGGWLWIKLIDCLDTTFGAGGFIVGIFFPFIFFATFIATC
jgi:hypothetical protein